jgi:hypothetical protein
VKCKLSCPKHPRYDPAMEGEGGIKGGCEVCRLLLQAHRSAMLLVDFVSEVHEKLKALRA